MRTYIHRCVLCGVVISGGEYCEPCVVEIEERKAQVAAAVRGTVRSSRAASVDVSAGVNVVRLAREKSRGYLRD